MSARDFRELAEARWAAGRFLCVGLDSEAQTVSRILEQLPEPQRVLESGGNRFGSQACFNRHIVDATSDIVGAFKPNSAFYEAQGADGIADLKASVAYINAVAPDVPVILDAKRGDIGSSNNAYAEYAFDYLGADAITVSPYLGYEATQSFLAWRRKCIFVLCRTSNLGAKEFQDRRLSGSSLTLFETVAERVANAWNGNRNCGLVVGATYPRELASVRSLAVDVPILIPGIGTQGGDLERSVQAGLNSRGTGIFINAARSVLFSSTSSDFREAARAEAERLDTAIRHARRPDES